MGLTSYKGEEVRKGDVTVAKNYLTRMRSANLIAWLICGWTLPRIRPVVVSKSLRDWQDKLDQFLQFNDREVLQGAGKISKKMADEKRRRSMFSLPNNNGA